METDSRTILVTGGGSGIGRATAAAFADEGDDVVILGRTEEKLHRAANEIGHGIEYQQADVGNRADVAAAVAEITNEHNEIDVLVNNAGIGRGVTTDDDLATAEKTWNSVIKTNLTGSFLMAVACAPHLGPGGRIVNISSIAAHRGGSDPGALAYAAAKAGVLGLTHSLARELSPDGITVNAITPGFIADTEFSEDWSRERIQSFIADTPVGRNGAPEDVAAAVVYLASSEASFVTGEVHSVNGGRLFGR